MRGTLRTLPIVGALLGCGGDGAANGDGCVFAVELTGAITASFTASDATTCAAANDNGGDPIAVFYPDHATLMRFDIAFESEVANMTGPDIPGDLSIITNAGAVWDTECTFDLTRWDGTGSGQRLAGRASCPLPAEPDPGTATITVGAVTFDMF